jgi:hypothetical protein
MTRLALLLLALPVFAQNNSKTTLRGRLIDDVYSQGVSRARLALSGGGLRTPLTAIASEQGAFSFPDLAPGAYRLALEKAGYFTPTPLDVQVGASQINLGDVILVRIRAISGVVRWSDGEPAAGASVQVLPVVAGQVSFRGIATGYSVSDRGTFRITNLRPGRYVLFASSAGYALSENPRPRIAPAVFFPGSDVAAGATKIDVRKTPEITDIDFTLRDRGGVTVEGIVAPSASFPAGSDVLIGVMVPNAPAPVLGLRRMKVGDSFRFLDIPPGQYMIAVSSDRDLCRGYESIQVGSDPLTNVRVTMPERVTVVVHTEMEEPGGQRTSPVPGIAIRGQVDKLFSYGITGFGSARPGQPLANGDLEATDVSPGATYRMDFNRLPANSYVESVTQGKNEQHFGPFEFVASSDVVRILLKKDGGTVGGTTVPRTFVVFAPKNRKAANRFLTTTADKDGNYQLSAIAPGDYELYAFDRNDEDSYLDEDYLQKYNAHVIAVTVQPNSSISLQPELTRVAGQ